MKQSWKPGTMIYPLPALLVSCGSSPADYNLFTVAWAGTICTNPAMCYISVRPERHSYALIKESMEVEFAEWDKGIEAARQELASQGVTFVESDVKAFQQQCQPLLDSIANRSDMTREVYDKVMAIKEREEPQ